MRNGFPGRARLSPFIFPLIVFALLLPSVSAQVMGPEFQVNTWTTNSQIFPAVAADGAGNFVVVWNSNTQDGFGSGIFGQRYDSSGAMLCDRFLAIR